MIDADRPKREPREDIFGYAPFAKTLAQSILRSSPANGFVVGIYGEWGLGKSTLLNFIEHYARTDVDEKTPLVVVRFNPWWFSGREDLVRRFFAELEKAALQADIKGRKNKKILLESIRQLGKASAKALAFVPAVPPGVAQVVEHATSLIPAEKLPDIVELKERIDRALNKAGLRVLVLIDEIDRLLPDEMIDVFRLVRSVGDLTGVNYVLAFDRDVVVQSLTNHLRLDGAKYLEKIVQAPFELPRPEPQILQRWFGNVLEGLFGESPGARFIDTQLRGPYRLWRHLHTFEAERDGTRLSDRVEFELPFGTLGDLAFRLFVRADLEKIFAYRAHEIHRRFGGHAGGQELSIRPI